MISVNGDTVLKSVHVDTVRKTGPLPQYRRVLSHINTKNYNNNNNNNKFIYTYTYYGIRQNYGNAISDFQVAFRLCFKASPGAKPFIWKLILFTVNEPTLN